MEGRMTGIFDATVALSVGIIVGSVAYEVDGYVGIGSVGASVTLTLLFSLGLDALEKRKRQRR